MIDPLGVSIQLSDPEHISAPLKPSLPRQFLLKPSPDHPDDYILECDNSALEDFSVCQRRFENSKIRGRKKAGDTSALAFGSLFHSCEELRLRYGLSPEIIVRQRELVVQHFETHIPHPEDHRTADRMIQVLNQYNLFYGSDTWPDRVMLYEDAKMLERPFKCILCTIPINRCLPYRYIDIVGDINDVNKRNALLTIRNLHIIWTGKIDLILHDSNSLWVVDYKTSSVGGSEWEAAFRLARQTVGYAWAAQQIIHQPIAGCIINGIIMRKPAKTSRAVRPDNEFVRPTYFYSQDRIAEWFEGVKYMMTDLATSLVRGYFPQTGPKSFKSPCVYCDYHENCQLPREQRDTDFASDFYRDNTWTPITQ